VYNYSIDTTFSLRFSANNPVQYQSVNKLQLR